MRHPVRLFMARRKPSGHWNVGVGWRARIRTWNPLIQSQVLYR
jgi:hypothetical protein